MKCDQGTEMAAHEAIRVDTGIQVYFCDPASPRLRAGMENANGLLRQYLPKGCRPLDGQPSRSHAIADELNGRRA